MMLRAEPARPHDLSGALELLGRSELTQQDVGEGWGHYFVVREDDGRVIGVAGLELHGEDGLLRSVAVDEDYRGQGLAGALIEAVLERAQRVGVRSVYLLTTTRAGLLRAPRLQGLRARRSAFGDPRVLGIQERLPLDRRVHAATGRLSAQAPCG